MNAKKIRQFLELAGHTVPESFDCGDESTRKLGAQLLLSELMEYITRGLKVIPEYQGVALTEPEAFKYNISVDDKPDQEEMLDGLADVAYTMYWNSEAFGIPLEAGFELVCDNNLQKFVKLESWSRGEVNMSPPEFVAEFGITWPPEVTQVQIKKVDGQYFAVGKDTRGKVRKPASYKAVDLSSLLSSQ